MVACRVGEQGDDVRMSGGDIYTLYRPRILHFEENFIFLNFFYVCRKLVRYPKTPGYQKKSPSFYRP